MFNKYVFIQLHITRDDEGLKPKVFHFYIVMLPNAVMTLFDGRDLLVSLCDDITSLYFNVIRVYNIMHLYISSVGNHVLIDR